MTYQPHMVDPGPAKRLRRAREMARFETAIDFARHAGVNPVTYQHHESGRRGITRQAASKYSKELGIPAGSLLYGETLQRTVAVPIVGHMIDGGRVLATHQLDGFNLDTNQLVTTLEDTDSYEALSISTQSLYPAYRMGDVAFFRRYPQGLIDLNSLVGYECVCKIKDSDELIVRQVMGQRDGRFQLVSYAGPPMINVDLEWASPVVMVRRAMPASISNL